MSKELKYSKVIIIIIVFLLIVGGLSLMFFVNLNNKNKVIVEDGKVVYVGEHYIVVQDENEDEYALKTNLEYNVGDRVSFTLTDIKKDSYPKEGTLQKLDTISKTVEFFISDSVKNDEVTSETNDTTNPSILNPSSSNSSVVNPSISGSSDGSENSEVAVVSYFRDLNKDLDNYSDDKNLGQDIKKDFVKIVDFLFYEGTINGKTFSGLSTTAKLEILKLFFAIDKKIEDYFPGYKEDISSTGSKIYTDVKSEALKVYMDVTTKVCVDNPDVCKSAKDGLSELKRSFSLTWDYIKGVSGEGIAKLKAWYEIWREA